MSKIRFTILTLIIATNFLSCSNSKKTTIIEDEMLTEEFILLNDTIRLKLWESKAIKKKNDVKVTFNRIAEDSRCPMGDNCIWEGNAVAEIIISKDSESEILTLNSNPSMEKSGNAYGYNVKLISVEPYPGTVGFDKEKYVIKIVVSEGSSPISNQ